jgi:hypothetical protein
MMLAYVFWHWTDTADIADYEKRLAGFHRALVGALPAGFRRSSSARVKGAPWIPRLEGYEDFYLVEDFAALGILNDAAVEGSRKEPHDRAAAVAAGGAGGLYRLIAGDPALIASTYAYWFGKPAGMTYAELTVLLAPVTAAPGVALWQRQMVLGPAPEYCLESPRPQDLPGRLAAAASRASDFRLPDAPRLVRS